MQWLVFFLLIVLPIHGETSYQELLKQFYKTPPETISVTELNTLTDPIQKTFNTTDKELDFSFMNETDKSKKRRELKSFRVSDPRLNLATETIRLPLAREELDSTSSTLQQTHSLEAIQKEKNFQLRVSYFLSRIGIQDLGAIEKSLLEMVSSNPNSTASKRGLGIFYYKTNRFKDAIQILQPLLIVSNEQSTKEEPVTTMYLLKCYYNLGMTTEFNKLLEKASPHLKPDLLKFFQTSSTLNTTVKTQ